MSTARKPPQLMGVAEVCDLTGLPKSTVTSWARRGTAGVPPHAALKAGPVWRRADMLEWLASTGRIN